MKIITLALSLLVILSFVGCGDKAAEKIEESKPDKKTEVQEVKTNEPVKTVQTRHMHQTTCLVTGEPVKRNLYVEIDHKRIYMASESSRAELKKNFSKYVKQMEEDGYHLGVH